jgi:hypothetical protein
MNASPREMQFEETSETEEAGSDRPRWQVASLNLVGPGLHPRWLSSSITGLL